MSTLKNKLVDKLAQVPEQVSGNLYRNGRSFYTVAKEGVTIRNTERQRNQHKLSWSDCSETYDWVEAVLESDDPQAKKLAKVIPLCYQTEELRVFSVGVGERACVALGADWADGGYTVGITHEDGYYRLFCYHTGDTYAAGTAEGVIARAQLMQAHHRKVLQWEA